MADEPPDTERISRDDIPLAVKELRLRYYLALYLVTEFVAPSAGSWITGPLFPIKALRIVCKMKRQDPPQIPMFSLSRRYSTTRDLSMRS